MHRDSEERAKRPVGLTKTDLLYGVLSFMITLAVLIIIRLIR